MGLKEWIIPQDKGFYDLLSKESATVLRGAIKLEAAVKSFDNMEERRKELRTSNIMGTRLCTTSMTGSTGASSHP